MPQRVPGINKTALWKAWKAIRKDLKGASIRDVVDHLEFDIDPDFWIRRLLSQIAQGSYEPAAPRRFTLGKARAIALS